MHKVRCTASPKTRQQKEVAEAKKKLERQKKDLGAEHVGTLDTLLQLGSLHLSLGKDSEAEAYFKSATAFERTLGPDHPSTLYALSKHGETLCNLRGEKGDCVQSFRRVLSRSENTLGPFHPETLEHRVHLAEALRQSAANAEEYSEVMQLLDQNVEGFEYNERNFGIKADSVLMIQTYSSFGAMARGVKLWESAEQYYRSAYEIAMDRGAYQAAHGKNFPEQQLLELSAKNNLGSVLTELGRYSEAEPLLRGALEGLQVEYGREHESTLHCCNHVGLMLKGMGKLNEAEAFFLRAKDGFERLYGNEHSETARAEKYLGELRSMM